MKSPGSHNTRDVPYSGQINTVAYSDSDRARFALKVDVSGGWHACWFWTGRIQPNGYGMFSMGGRAGAPRYAHRVAYEITHGPIPAGQSVLHRCDQRNCVNPGHLFLGDHTANMRDAASKGRLNVPRPTAQKLTDAHCEAIVARVAAGETQAFLAKAYGVSRAWISLLVSGRRRQYRKTA